MTNIFGPRSSHIKYEIRNLRMLEYVLTDIRNRGYLHNNFGVADTLTRVQAARQKLENYELVNEYLRNNMGSIPLN
jgi:hypothetical protein